MGLVWRFAGECSLYLTTQEVQNKWKTTKLRNWSEIYPQLCIILSEIMEKYTKLFKGVVGGLHSLVYKPQSLLIWNAH